MARTCRRIRQRVELLTPTPQGSIFANYSRNREVIMTNRDNHFMWSGRLGRAVEGKMDTWDDVGSNFPKNAVSKDIRRWHKKQTQVHLQEHYESTEELRLELQAIEDEIEEYYNDLDEDDFFMDTIREANEDYWESKYDEYFDGIDE